MHKSVAKSFVLEMELFDKIAAYGFRNQTYAWETYVTTSRGAYLSVA